MKTVDIGLFYPLNIFHLFGFPSLKSSDPKIIPRLFENFSQRKGSQNSR